MKEQIPDLSVGTYVWIKSILNEKYDVPRACRILSAKNKQLKVVDDDGQEFWVSVGSALKGLHPSSLIALDDMIALGELEEYSILRNLHIRYNRNLIYTYIGMVLIAVNPYQQLPIYSETERKKYKGSKLTELPPHLYAIGNECFQSLIKQRKSQCIIISGETGAGKTESTKVLLEYLAAQSGKKTQVEQQIIQANPVLEAFGNARTVHNDNSSRFGKLIELNYNELGSLEGASIQQYLLEKSRVTQLKIGDQNYHIFYSLIRGLSWNEKCELDLKSCYQFDYLNKTDPKASVEINEAIDLTKIMAAMDILNFSKSDIWEIFKMSAVVLHLGNISYNSNVTDNIEGTDVKEGPSLDNVCKFLQVQKKQLKDTLSKKALYVQGHKTVTEVTKVQAMMTRNGFAKTLYDKLFNYIVNKINIAIFNKKCPRKYSIRILDIYGFENFQNNSFEQLCINYTNEHLQQVFVRHIFKMEQEEYTKEGIKWEHLRFIDNEEILYLIGLKPYSLMMIIDEQSQLISGTDEAVIVKANKTHAKNKYYIKQKSDISCSFGISHYAGVVNYSVEGFLDKNRNPLTSNWVQLIETSKNAFLKSLFLDELNKQNQHSQAKVQTVSSQYQHSLGILLQLINSSQPYFIRCIKPNLHKKPKEFNHALCCCQLRYSGMMETAKIRRSGYPVRYSYIHFVHRFRIIIGSPPNIKPKECKRISQEICKKVLGSNDYQLGKTKVFLKTQHDVSLEGARDRILEKKIIIIQKNCKALYAKNRYKRMKNGALLIQKTWRRYRAQKTYNIIRQGFLRLQARCRGFLVRREVFKRMEKQKVQYKREESIGDIDAWINSVFTVALQDTEHNNLITTL
ncbi:unconventional myosin-VIIa-like isoform X2 [Lycorma delicatula]|uniref:unconventional myosin-VIIa-like isoform X2 n=1 Tax=Lycorma delicatula TaxID=130591 RepID=UPI003F51A100